MLPDNPFPSENTLTMNVGYGVLSDLKSLYPDTIGIVPDRLAEDDYGYDMAVDWDWWKSVAMQFKSPFDSGGIRAKSGEFLKFRIEMEQFAGIARDYDTKEAFYTLPPITNRNYLHTEPDRTRFVDIHAIADEIYRDPSQVRLLDSRDYAQIVVPYELTDPSFNGSLASTCGILITTKNGYYEIKNKHIYSWDDIRSGLLFGNIGRQSASYSGGAAVATDGGEEPPFENEDSPLQYNRPPEIIVRGDSQPEEKDQSTETAFE